MGVTMKPGPTTLSSIIWRSPKRLVVKTPKPAPAKEIAHSRNGSQDRNLPAKKQKQKKCNKLRNLNSKRRWIWKLEAILIPCGASSPRIASTIDAHMFTTTKNETS